MGTLARSEKVANYVGFRKWCIEQASIRTSIIPAEKSLFDRAKAIHNWVLNDQEPAHTWDSGPYFITKSIEGVEQQLNEVKAQIEADGGELVKIYVQTLAMRKGGPEELLYKRGSCLPITNDSSK